jgi:class 3 adenylate cyclase
VPFNIFFVQDSEKSSFQLQRFVHDRLPKLANRTFRSNWDFATSDFATQGLDGDDVEALSKVAHDDWREALRRIFEKHRFTPDILITDLALNPADDQTLEDGRADDPEADLDAPQLLAQIGGYHVVGAFHEECPVIVTTFVRHPLLMQECLKQGAFAYVPKPGRDDEMAKWLVGRPTRANAATLSLYWEAVSHEVLKALRDNVLSLLANGVPKTLAYQLATEGEAALAPQAREDTVLLLLDVRGFMTLSARVQPYEAMFPIMQTIWKHVREALVPFDINTYTGDGAWVFCGVYEQPPKLEDVLQRAMTVCDLFDLELDTCVQRELLDEVLKAECSHMVRSAYETLREFVSSTAFGIRVIIGCPEKHAVWYGNIGTNKRWEHSAFGQYLNVLARAEKAVSSWEKPERGARWLADKRAGHAFLLWRKDALPDVAGVSFTEAAEYLAGFDEDVAQLPQEVTNYNAGIYKIERTERRGS